MSFLKIFLCSVTVVLSAMNACCAEWHDMQNKAMDDIASHPVEKQIEILGGIVTVGSNPVLNPDTAEVFQRSRQMLIAIPGHAKYYGNIILEKHANYKADIIGNTQQGRLMPYHDTAMRTFGLLKLLPSAETVEVLGEMLSEEWQDHEEQEYYEPSLGASAMMCLNDLPIVGKLPVEGKNALRGWQNWYAQIKEGRRTFRFEGNPQEYSLRGPAREALNPDIPRVSKRPSQQQAAIEADDELHASRSNAPTIAAVVIALLFGGGYWIYRKRQAG